jgi:hypothetical protein
MQRPPNAIVNLKLRLEERLRRQLERDARKADRSMNAEIIDRLEKSFVEPALVERIHAAVKSGNDEVARRLVELQSAFNEISSALHRSRARMADDPVPPATIPGGKVREVKPPGRGSLGNESSAAEVKPAAATKGPRQ